MQYFIEHVYCTPAELMPWDKDGRNRPAQYEEAPSVSVNNRCHTWLPPPKPGQQALVSPSRSPAAPRRGLC